MEQKALKKYNFTADLAGKILAELESTQREDKEKMSRELKGRIRSIISSLIMTACSSEKTEKSFSVKNFPSIAFHLANQIEETLKFIEVFHDLVKLDREKIEKIIIDFYNNSYKTKVKAIGSKESDKDA